MHHLTINIDFFLFRILLKFSFQNPFLQHIFHVDEFPSCVLLDEIVLQDINAIFDKASGASTYYQLIT